MTDKQIIIDGCDVSGCEYCSRYADTTVYNCDWIGECKEHPNCHYKQLQYEKEHRIADATLLNERLERITELEETLSRKEQECEELKTKLINWLGKVSLRQSEKEFCEQQLNQLKVELQAEKEKVKELNKVAEYFMEEDGKIYTRKEYKYKQTLTEIKPILELYANSNMGEEQPDKTYKILLNGGYIAVYNPKPARQALQKISECEV